MMGCITREVHPVLWSVGGAFTLADGRGGVHARPVRASTVNAAPRLPQVALGLSTHPATSRARKTPRAPRPGWPLGLLPLVGRR